MHYDVVAFHDYDIVHDVYYDIEAFGQRHHSFELRCRIIHDVQSSHRSFCLRRHTCYDIRNFDVVANFYEVVGMDLIYTWYRKGVVIFQRYSRDIPHI